MKKFALAIAFISAISNAQVLDRYPKGQEDYYGGNQRFYQDFHQILLDHKFQPCENKQEFYLIKLVVYPDKTVKFVHPEDTAAVARNKCTFDLTKGVLKYMDRWKPATVDGREVPAITSFMIYPDDLFEKYETGYDPEKYMKPAEFPGGINAFRNKIFKISDLSGFTFVGKVRVDVRFSVEKDGTLGDYKIVESSGLKAFDDRIISNLKYIKTRWKPATFHDVPIRQRYNLPITINGK